MRRVVLYNVKGKPIYVNTGATDIWGTWFVNFRVEKPAPSCCMWIPPGCYEDHDHMAPIGA